MTKEPAKSDTLSPLPIKRSPDDKPVDEPLITATDEDDIRASEVPSMSNDPPPAVLEVDWEDSPLVMLTEAPDSDTEPPAAFDDDGDDDDDDDDDTSGLRLLLRAAPADSITEPPRPRLAGPASSVIDPLRAPAADSKEIEPLGLPRLDPLDPLDSNNDPPMPSSDAPPATTNEPPTSVPAVDKVSPPAKDRSPPADTPP